MNTKPVKLPTEDTKEDIQSIIDRYNKKTFFEELQDKYLPWDMTKSSKKNELVLRSKSPILYFLLYDVETFYDNVCRILKDTKYWFLYRLHPGYRGYWNVYPKTLKPGYNDPDELLLHANMHILCDFYEFTTTKGHTDWQYDERHQNYFNQMKTIYEYWTIERPNKEKEMDLEYDNIPEVEIDDINECHRSNPHRYDKIREIEDYIEKKDTEMLHLLIDIRTCLWD